MPKVLHSAITRIEQRFMKKGRPQDMLEALKAKLAAFGAEAEGAAGGAAEGAAGGAAEGAAGGAAVDDVVKVGVKVGVNLKVDSENSDSDFER
ncbi:hypothetical protein TeGR_g12184 [Tetraparma gracilis]|uniref:Uncharacterized protein n=1 Tax=Tetraparma gracilis TaxID=2962635 RepID=A0ABQ6MTX9_9STRA|nr:hypothetical protein TeGR_g12184 [Tetraparma gracilis]